MQNKTRPDWDTYFLSIAKVVSTRASCPRASVGAVIVSEDHRILSTGYNGAPTGQRDCLTYGCQVSDGHCQRSIHAEVNAVVYASKNSTLIGSKMYIYDSLYREGPCRECQKVLLAAGIQW